MAKKKKPPKPTLPRAGPVKLKPMDLDWLRDELRDLSRGPHSAGVGPALQKAAGMLARKEGIPWKQSFTITSRVYWEMRRER